MVQNSSRTIWVPPGARSRGSSLTSPGLISNAWCAFWHVRPDHQVTRGHLRRLKLRIAGIIGQQQKSTLALGGDRRGDQAGLGANSFCGLTRVPGAAPGGGRSGGSGSKTW